MSIADTPAAVLPTHLDLPCTDGKHAENSYQPYQTALLTEILTPLFDRLHPEGDYFVGMDNGIFWEVTNPPLDGSRSPDWYYVPGVPKLLDGALRRSYVLWKEQVPPLVVVEFVSGSGAEEYDRTPPSGKWWVYEQAVKAEYYVIRDPFREELEVYRRSKGRYRAVAANAAGRFPIEPLGIELGVWEGLYESTPAVWLRAWDRNGTILPLKDEVAVAERVRADHEKSRADNEKSRADNEKSRADALAARLRALGVDPDAP